MILMKYFQRCRTAAGEFSPSSPTSCPAMSATSRPPSPSRSRYQIFSFISTKCFQLLGFEVDTINSVQFSNHTGYTAGVRGQVVVLMKYFHIFT